MKADEGFCKSTCEKKEVRPCSEKLLTCPMNECNMERKKHCDYECNGNMCRSECQSEKEKCHLKCTGIKCEVECTADRCKAECIGSSCIAKCHGEKCIAVRRHGYFKSEVSQPHY
ncbi:uncharacterized protein LOC125236091 [Leguminivora glycinivorella]|uniref:uncharacterized protein LOC125236091 n=1 Tax=Leguminivora glycinivorella TaxID=1035111 RepID=UPI00200BCFED|nr:uncharacterized protein LOC125236091 [Leguminivora glycinivorella]